MAAPKGNQYAKGLTNSGRPRTFSKPSELAAACDSYFTWADENPWNKIDFRGKDATKVKIPTQRPYLLREMLLHIDLPESTWYDYEKRDEFSEVVARVKKKIESQQISGALVGAYNGNIVARLNGLVDKKEVKQKNDPLDTSKMANLTDEERAQLVALNRKARASD